MAQKNSVAQIKTADIVRGLFIVRYVSADDQSDPPIVTLGFDPPQDQNGQFILHPDASEPVLWQPGSALIMRAARPVKVRIEVNPRRPAGSIAANVKVERITQGEPVDVSAGWETGAGDLDFTGLRLLGHVAGIGDVVASPNEWIAGPSAPSRIEGIGIDWADKPPQLDIRYSVKLGRPQAAPSRTMEIGSFAGTRGQAMPLTGVVFELSGAAGADYQINAEAAFLGSPTMRVIGKRVVLTGPTGREPLVGLRLNVERADMAAPAREPRFAGARTAEASPPPPPAPPARQSVPQPPPPPQPPRQSGATPVSPRAASRVRVFRSRPKEGPSTG